MKTQLELCSAQPGVQGKCILNVFGLGCALSFQEHNDLMNKFTIPRERWYALVSRCIWIKQ